MKNKKLRKWVQWTSKLLGVIGIAAGVALLIGFPLMWLINFVFPVQEITFWQAVCLFLIVKILEPTKS